MNRLKNIIDIITYIEDHLNEKLTLSSIAQAVGYSKYHLHRSFQYTTGLSIHEYVQRRQLTEAAKRLVFSKESILAIAFLSGYESQQAFTLAFKQMYKQSPNEYRSHQIFYPLQLPFQWQENAFQTINYYSMQDITLMTTQDIPLWMELVQFVIDGFPNLQEEEHLQSLYSLMKNKSAFILKEEHYAIAIMALDYQTGNIDFFAVHPLYRHSDIVKLFLEKISHELHHNRPISMTTFREGDKADTGYRETLQKLGFVEDELLIEFGYPTQKMILHPQYGEHDES